MNSSPKQTAGLYYPKHQQSLDVRGEEEKNAKTLSSVFVTFFN